MSDAYSTGSSLMPQKKNPGESRCIQPLAGTASLP
jgi:argininosuccinate lyase